MKAIGTCKNTKYIFNPLQKRNEFVETIFFENQKTINISGRVPENLYL